MFKRTLLWAVLSLPLCAHAATAATGTQAPAARPYPITGLVRDALGRPIAAAHVALTTADGRVAAETHSDDAGHFAFDAVPAGTYAVLSDKHGYQTGSAIVTLSNGPASTAITLAASEALEISIATTRLEPARSGVTPSGGSVYHFDAADIAHMPQGESTALNQVLLQAPGVVNDSFGQLHIRGDHGNAQYRINGVMLPEGISGFGQALDTRFAQNIDLLTGALPAQYGLHTAGVIEIATKSRFEGGGHVDVYGGSNRTFNPSFQYGNTQGDLSYFIDGSYLTNNQGIQNPTSSVNPLHDTTEQYKGFGYLSYMLNPDTKLSFLLSSYDGSFQIPNNPGQTTYVTANGYTPLAGLPASYDSTTLNDRQNEVNRFVVAALQSSLSDAFDFQAALFTRYSSVHYLPDVAGNLAFNGVAADVFRSSSSSGLQADGNYRLNTAHTLHMGLFGSSEDVVSNNTTTLFSVTGSGQPVGSSYSIVDNNPKSGNTLFGAYLQDEWRATGRLTVNYGARFDQVNAFVNEHQLSPRLNLVYKASAQTTWHAGYARYFTPPPTELVSATTQALFNNTTNTQPGQNSPVHAERSHYLDAGVSHQLSETTSVGLDTFYKQSRNVIDEGQFGSALIMTPYNYEQGKIYGIELTSNYHAGNVSGYANLARTVSKARNIISSQYLFNQATLNYAANNWVNVDHQQALTISLGGSYLWSGTTLDANLSYQSGLRNGFANTGSLPGYTVLNLGASRKFDVAGLGKIEGRVALVNALDQVYLIRDGSGIGVGAPQYGARRGVFAGVSKPF